MEYIKLFKNKNKEITVLDQTVWQAVVNNSEDTAGLFLNIKEGAGAHLIWYKFSSNQLLTVNIEKRAHFTLSVVSAVSQAATCMNIQANLLGDGAQANLFLALNSKNDSQMKLTVNLNHMATNTTGRINSKRVLFDSAKGELNSLLSIRESAHNADSYLSDKVMLVGKTCQAKSDPQLEILAHDVRASHGVTISRLLPDELLYLRSRGLSYEIAQKLILTSFLKPALIGVPLNIIKQLLHDI